jgi:hypothetical protein
VYMKSSSRETLATSRPPGSATVSGWRPAAPPWSDRRREYSE